MRVLIVAEDPNEEAALPILVRQLNAEIGDIAFDRFKNIPRRVHGMGNWILKRGLGWFTEAAERGFDGIVLILDEDGDRARRNAIDDAQCTAAHPLPRACGIAIRTFDAWFLADEQALSSTLDRVVQRQPILRANPIRRRHARHSFLNATL